MRIDPATFGTIDRQAVEAVAVAAHAVVVARRIGSPVEYMDRLKFLRVVLTGTGVDPVKANRITTAARKGRLAAGEVQAEFAYR